MAYLCNRRRRRCSGPKGCGHKFTKEEYDLWACPVCGRDRHCEEPVAREGAACRFHGGKSLGGAASPLFKEGRYSQKFPPKIRDRYLAALADPDRADLTHEIALVDMRIGDLVESWQSGDIGAAMLEAQAEFRLFAKAIADDDQKEFQKRYSALGKVIDRGAIMATSQTWERLHTMIELRRKLTETQNKKDQLLGFTLEDANMLIVFLQTAIIRYVSNPKERAQLAAEIESFATQGVSESDPRV